MIMNAVDVVCEWLKAHADEYDGLVHPGVCGCLTEDLVPCGQMNAEGCEPGHKVLPPFGEDDQCDTCPDCEWHIVAGPKEEKL